MPSAPKTSLSIRQANVDDLDDLVTLENAGFETDRLSRRSFRHWLGQTGGQRTNVTLVAVATIDGRASTVGYGLLLFRKGTAMARLYSLAVSPQARGLGAGKALLAALEDAAFEHDRLTVRLEVSETNTAAISLYEKAGYHRFGTYPDYYDDGSSALRYEKWLRGRVDVATDTPYYEQTTDFTCGPACLLMGLRRFYGKGAE